MWSVISAGEGFAVGERDGQDGGICCCCMEEKRLIDTYQPAALNLLAALHIKEKSLLLHTSAPQLHRKQRLRRQTHLFPTQICMHFQRRIHKHHYDNYDAKVVM